MSILVNPFWMLKWFIRLALIIFWIPALYYTLSGQGFLTWMITQHTWTTVALLTLTFYFLLGPFYAPFLTLKTDGGDKVMERSTKILIFLSALLGALVVAMAIPPSRTVILSAFTKGFLAPIGSAIGGFNQWLTAFEPLHVLGASVLGGLVLAVAINMFVRPRIQKLRKPTPTKDYLGAPGYTPPQDIGISTSVASSAPIKKKVTTEEIIEEEVV